MSAPRGQNQNHDSIIVFLPQYVTKWNKHNPSKRHTKTITNRAIQNRSRPGCLLQSPVFTDEKRKTIKQWELKKKTTPHESPVRREVDLEVVKGKLIFFIFFILLFCFHFQDLKQTWHLIKPWSHLQFCTWLSCHVVQRAFQSFLKPKLTEFLITLSSHLQSFESLKNQQHHLELTPR